MQHQPRLNARILSILIGLLALLAPTAPLRAAGVIYVVPGGAGPQTGVDWANASDLQAALQSATSGDQIWVKAGIYKPTAGSDRSATFQLKSGIAVYGGFAGSKTTLSALKLSILEPARLRMPTNPGPVMAASVATTRSTSLTNSFKEVATTSKRTRPAPEKPAKAFAASCVKTPPTLR